MKTLLKAVAYIAVIIICLVVIGISHADKSTAQHNAQLANGKAQMEDTQLEDKRAHILNSVKSGVFDSKNPVLRSFGQNRVYSNIIDVPINELARTTYTWNNESQYQSIPSKLANVATPQVLHNKALYGSDKDFSGQSMIKNLGVHREFDSSDITMLSKHKNNITALAGITYSAWEKSNGQSKTDSPNGEQFLLMTVNEKTKKITSLTPIYTDTNIEINN